MDINDADYHRAMEAVSEHFDDLVCDHVTMTDLSYSQIARKHGLETKYVQRLAKAQGISRPRGAGSAAYPRPVSNR